MNKPYLDAALQGHAQTFERIIPGPAGTVRYSLAQYVPDVADGQVRGLLVHVADVTPLKDTEEALRQEMAERARVHELLLSSAAELDQAQQLGAIGSWSWQVDGNRVAWSAELSACWAATRRWARHPSRSRPVCIRTTALLAFSRL